MLRLKLRVGECIRIGDNIIVKVIAVERRINGLVAKLGIWAPKEIEVHRKEVWLKMKEADGDAANAAY